MIEKEIKTEKKRAANERKQERRQDGEKWRK